MVNRELDLHVKDVLPEWLGQANKVIVSSKKTAFLGFMGDDEQLVERLQDIESEELMAENEFYKKKHSVRYGRLQGNAAVIGISGLSEQEISNKLERVDDALNATRAAIAEGVIRGAGVELYRWSLKQNSWPDASTGEVYDPVRVVKSSIRSAVSVAGYVLTADCLIGE